MMTPKLLIAEGALPIDILRDKNTRMAEFRAATHQLSPMLAARALLRLPTLPKAIDTPVGPTSGSSLVDGVLLAPVLRSGMALLPSFLSLTPSSPVAFVGLERDEETLAAVQYCWSCPEESPSQVMIIDPMLATGNSAVRTVALFLEEGFAASRIYYAGFFASGKGLDRLSRTLPPENITMVVVDPELTDRGWIKPGCGDFGNRYYGTPRKPPKE